MAKSRRTADQGEEQGALGPGDLRYDDFIRRIRPRPDSTDPITVLHGYIGESTVEDRIRLYSDASLASYVEIAIADILFSLPNEDDPLGGSRIWVRQNANVQYNEATAYTQGDMYNDYMADAYAPGNYGAEAAAAVSVGQLACPVAITKPAICGPSQFICPTPASRVVLCRTILVRCRTLNVVQCATPRNIRSICRPCYVTPPGPGPIGGGGIPNDPYGGYADYGDAYGGYGDYTGGQLYDDYVNNQYDPGGYAEFGPLNTIACPRVSFIQVCPSVALNCPTRTPLRCTIVTLTRRRPLCPPLTCQLGTRFPTIPPQSLAGCPSDFCTPGGGFPADPRAGGFMNDPYGYGAYGADPYGSYGDYTNGDVYNDYMSNYYTPETAAMGGGAGATVDAPCAAAAPTRLPFCNQPSVLTICPTVIAHLCPTRQRTILQCCITRMPSICCPPTNPNYPPCRTRLPFCRTIQLPLCRPTLPQGCPTGLVCGVNPGGVGGNYFGGYDPYGYGY